MNDPEVNVHRPRVLLVDDNADGRKALARLLELKGYAVTSAADGTLAVEALRAGPPPEIVLTDLQLPDLDGREVAAVARQVVPRPYIALITGWTLGHDLQPGEASGLDEVFFKPLDIQELFTTLDEVMKARGGPAPSA